MVVCIRSTASERTIGINSTFCVIDPIPFESQRLSIHSYVYSPPTDENREKLYSN